MNQDAATDSAPSAWSIVMRAPLGGKIPRPPRIVHEKRICASVARTYCSVLNDDGAFRRALADLLDHWTWTAAERLARRWRLLDRGVADLWWTYTLWRRQLLRMPPRLQLGSRSYPGQEHEGDEEEARRLGYRRHPSRLKDVCSLHLDGLRLYRRAVLEWP